MFALDAGDIALSGQDVQASAPYSAEYFPSGHPTHSAVPASALNVPGRHLLQVSDVPSNPLIHPHADLLADPSTENEFGGHVVQDVAAGTSLYEPAAHKTQSVVPLLALYEPALQILHPLELSPL